MSAWPPELDAVVAAGPYHIVLMENEFVRVLETRIPPGHCVPVHTHQCCASVYLISWSEAIRRDDKGEILLDTRGQTPPTLGTVGWQEPLGPHTFENVGTCDIHVITTEVKATAAPDA